jgi:phosphoenolpyruvate carboxylase
MLNKLQRLAQRLHNPEALIEDEITGIANPRALEREITSLWLTDRSRTAARSHRRSPHRALVFRHDALADRAAVAGRTRTRPGRHLSHGQGADALDHLRLLDGRRPRRQPRTSPRRSRRNADASSPARLDKLQISLRELSRQLSVSSRLDGISPELAQRLRSNKQTDSHVRATSRSVIPTSRTGWLWPGCGPAARGGKAERPQWLLHPEAGDTPASALKTGDVAELLDLISESLSTHRAALLAEGELHRLRQQVDALSASASPGSMSASIRCGTKARCRNPQGAQRHARLRRALRGGKTARPAAQGPGPAGAEAARQLHARKPATSSARSAC